MNKTKRMKEAVLVGEPGDHMFKWRLHTPPNVFIDKPISEPRFFRGSSFTSKVHRTSGPVFAQVSIISFSHYQLMIQSDFISDAIVLCVSLETFRDVWQVMHMFGCHWTELAATSWLEATGVA